MKIVVLGYIVRGPYGGLVWHHLQYVLGLKKLGHEVLFLEDSDNYPGCSNPFTGELTTDPSHGLKFLQKVFNDFGIKDSWAYYDAHTNTWHGLNREKVFLFCNGADIVLNISAINPLRDWCAKIPNRILIDTDPVFTQIRHLTNKTDFELARQHTAFFSFGENFGKLGCTIPNDGFNWQSTRQPVFLDAWNFGEVNTNGKWTTVMQWDSYNQRKYKNGVYGMKSKSFSEFEDLPKLLQTENFELAIGGATAPIEQLKSNGWNVISSLIPTKTADSYQHFIQQSKGEWSIAKHGYVVSNSGWFSERSAAYLASGKPVIVQNTGFADFIETGRGLFSFSALQDIANSFETVNSNYIRHHKWAREIANEYFSGDKVLHSLLKNSTR
jgi:hypothetical protein